MSKTIPFTGQTCPIVYASREVVEWNGTTRERWITVILQPDGESDWRGPHRSRKDAIWISAIIADGFTKQRQARVENPLYDAILKLPQEYQTMMMKAMQRQFGGKPPDAG